MAKRKGGGRKLAVAQKPKSSKSKGKPSKTKMKGSY